MKEKTTKSNQSVEKVFRIIEIMAENRFPMRLQDISAGLGLPTSTVLRFLATLMKFKYVDQDPETLKYSLTMKFARIGSLVSSQISIKDIAKPYLIELSMQCRESTCLAIENDMEVVYIEAVDGPDSMLRTMQRIGKLAPLHSTGVGKLLLLNYDAQRLEQMIRQKGLRPLTPHTITSKDALLDELRRVRARGYSIDDEECELGARCIAAPVADYSGKVIAAISVSGPVARMTREKLDSVAPLVMDAARQLSAKMAYEAESSGST